MTVNMGVEESLNNFVDWVQRFLGRLTTGQALSKAWVRK